MKAPGERTPRRRKWLALALLAAVATARAQEARWPSRPVRILLAYPPGGVSDQVARALAERLAARWQVPVLVDHRAGAGGALAMQALAAAAPDGHTLCFSAIAPLTLLPQLGRVGYDVVRDIAPVAAVMFTPALLVATRALRVDSFAALRDEARQGRAPLRWATSGEGTTGHMLLELVRQGTGLAVTHVPYKGGGQQLNDALAGEFELLSTNVGAQQLAYIRAGRLRPLAVGAPARVHALPEVPTFAELGLPAANVGSLFGLFAPGGTPAGHVTRLNEDVRAVLREPALRERLLAMDNLPQDGSAADFAAQVAREAEAWRQARPLRRPPASPASRP